MEKVFKKISSQGLEGFLFSSQPSVFYLARFSSTHAYVLLTARGERVLITDSRYLLKAKNRLSPLGWEIREIKSPLYKNLAHIVKDYGVKNLGIEGDRVYYNFYEKLKKALSEEGIKVIPLGGFLDEFRMVKTPEEIKKIAKAVEITDKAFNLLVEFLKENRKGITKLKEKDLRRFLICEYLKEGAQGESFPAIVASGKNSAIPHHETTDKTLQENAPLLIDTGCVWKGYCSDFTRTLFIGKPDKELLKVYEIVKEAHLRAVGAVREGLPIGEIDKVAREYIEKNGYGEYFTHSTGHGVGIEIHEPPRVYQTETTPIREGMVFTIEPGIYLPQKGGVRIENIVAVVGGKAKVLQKTPIELVVI